VRKTISNSVNLFQYTHTQYRNTGNAQEMHCP